MNLKTMIVAVTSPAASGGIASAQRELSAFQDTKGYIDVQKLTCRRLANTYQEDANLPRVWYSGLAHKHAINVPRLQQNIHDVIVYCKADQDITIIKRST
jgi:hypothetical protein